MNAREIAIAIGGRRAQRLADGSYLVPCPVPSHGKGRGDRSPSLRIGDGDRQLLVHCYSGCNRLDVLAELRRRGLLDDRPAAKAHHGSPLRPAPKPQTPDAYARQQHHKAAWLWTRRRPIAGTIAEKYLREARGIACPLPRTLAFLPPSKPEHHPAMIAAFGLVDEPSPGQVGEPRDVGAVHLTLLKPDGTGKADIERPKLMVGSPGALPIVLAPPNDLLAIAIAEGVEDALALHQALGLGALAGGSAGRMPALADVIPGYIEAVTIEAHPDAAGQKSAAELVARLRARGVEIFPREAAA